MGTLVMIGQVVLALAILITLHEWGHFAAARKFGIKVEKFYLFFDAWGFKLFKFKRGDTEYGMGWLPLGGYVKIAGMVDESLDKEQLKKEPEPWEFRSKPAWQRLIVMVGGVFVNLVLGLFIYSMVLFYYGDEYIPMNAINNNGGVYVSETGKDLGFETGDKILLVNGEPLKKIESFFSSAILLQDDIVVEIERNNQPLSLEMPSDMADILSSNQKVPPFAPRIASLVDSVVEGSLAEQIGLQKGDQLLALVANEEVFPIQFFDELSVALEKHKNTEVLIEVLRDQKNHFFSLTIDSTAKLGFLLANTFEGMTEKQHFSLPQSFIVGTSRSFGLLYANMVGLGSIITGKIKAKNALQGPVAIAGLFGKQWDWQRFWNLTAILSLILAFMNLLPIPALDGGHVVFLLIEMATGKPVNDKVLHVAQVVGMILLLSLMVFVIGNDIFRAFR